MNGETIECKICGKCGHILEAKGVKMIIGTHICALTKDFLLEEMTEAHGKSFQ
jgi:hypothetical protein